MKRTKPDAPKDDEAEQRPKDRGAIWAGVITGLLALIGSAAGILLSSQFEREGFLRTERLDRYSSQASATQVFLLDLDVWAAAAKSQNGSEQDARTQVEESYRKAVESAWNVRLIAPAEAEEINQEISQKLDSAYRAFNDGFVEGDIQVFALLSSDVNGLLSDLAEHASTDVRAS